MIKLIKNSIVRSSDLSIGKIRVDQMNLINNKLVISNQGIHIKFHVDYHDNLGDKFDMVSLNNKYILNRNDLVSFRCD